MLTKGYLWCYKKEAACLTPVLLQGPLLPWLAYSTVTTLKNKLLLIPVFRVQLNLESQSLWKSSLPQVFQLSGCSSRPNASAGEVWTVPDLKSYYKNQCFKKSKTHTRKTKTWALLEKKVPLNMLVLLHCINYFNVKMPIFLFVSLCIDWELLK